MERILCAAVWLEEFEPKDDHLPSNLETGMVICGRRHHNCFSTASLLAMDRIQSGEIKYRPITQGFITSENRFLTREQAAVVALEAGQIQEPTKKLYSEDLY